MAQLRVIQSPVDLYRFTAPPLPGGYPLPAVGEIRLREIDMYVTMRCNLRCSFCSVRAGEYSRPELPLERIKSLLDEAVELGAEHVHFSGGEATVRHDIDDILSHAASHSLSPKILTNGLCLPRRRLQELISAGLAEVLISIDGMEATHNRLRLSAPDGWQTSMQCVADCVDLGLRSRVACIAYVDNYDEISDLMHLVERMGIDIFSVWLGSPLGRGHTLLDRIVDPYRWRQLQERLARESSRLRSNFEVVMEQGFAWKDAPRIDRSILKGRGTGCNTLLEDYDYLIIRSDGNLYQCVFFVTDGRPIGNVWHQPLGATLKYAREIAEYKAFTVANDRCTNCFHQVECGTGCRGYAYLYKGDWLKTDPRCDKRDSESRTQPEYFPLCPIMKVNVRTGQFGGCTEQASSWGQGARVGFPV